MEWLKKNVVYIRNIYTSLFASFAAVLFSFIIFDAYFRTYSIYEVNFQKYAAQAFLAILFPIVTVGMAWVIFNYFDNLDLFNKREYQEKYIEFKKNGTAIKPLIAQKPYLIKFAIEMLFSTVVFTAGYSTALLFFFPSINIVVPRLLSIATMAILRLLQLNSLQDKWETEIDHPLFVEKSAFKRNRDPYTFKFHQMIWQPIGFVILFSFATSFAAAYGFAIFLSIFYIIISPDMWGVIFTFPLIFIALIYLGRLIHNTRKRAILIKKIKQMKHEGLADVSIKGRKYLSATFTFLPFSIDVTDKNGEKYHCLIISASKINAPMYFKPDEYLVEHGMHLRGGALMSHGGRFARAVDISSWGGKENPTNMILGFRMAHKLKFPEGEGHNVVILSPAPTTAFSIYGRDTKPIDTGEDMQKYTIYTPTGFFNHIERQSRKGKFDY